MYKKKKDISKSQLPFGHGWLCQGEQGRPDHING